MIFRRALQREFATTAVGVFVALFAIVITVVLIRMLGQAAGGRVPPDAVMALIGFGALAQLPVVLSLTLFVAILMSLSRAYRDSEMVVWFASGQPLTGFISPVLRFALPAVAVIAGMTLFVTPWANFKSEQFRAELDSRDDTTRVAPGVFRESSGASRVFFVEGGGTSEDGRLESVFVQQSEGDQISVIASAHGSIRTEQNGDRFVVLDEGHRYDGRPGTAEYRVVEFERYHVLIESRRQAEQTRRASTTPTAELLEQPTARHMSELAGRINAPIAALLLALLAVPLAYVNPRAGRSYNLIIAILAYLLYSNFLSIGQAWVQQGRMPLALAMLVPHLVVAGIVALMFHRRIALRPFWRRA